MEISKYITPITIKDFPLYQQFFVQTWSVACYGNSWSYITQACRQLGLGNKYYDRDILVSIGKYQDHYVIVRPLGNIDHRFLKLVQLLFKRSHKPVFIKKVFDHQAEQIKRLQPQKFSEAATDYSILEEKCEAGKYSWHQNNFADDDTYPELIFNLDLSLKIELTPSQWLNLFQQHSQIQFNQQQLKSISKSYQEFRRRINRFNRLEINCCLQPYQANIKPQIIDLISNYFGISRQENIQAYRNIFDFTMLTQWEKKFFPYFAYIDNEQSPIAFMLLEKLDQKSIGSYARIICAKYPGLPEYLMLQIMSQLKKIGFQFLNTGGSENKKLHTFKKKLAPIEQRTMKMLVYGAI